MDSRISAVVCFIGKRPAADMDTLATAVNLSPSRLRHLFRLEMATALHAYLKQQRLSRAAELLKTTFLTVKEVSAATGFADPDHFSREFRKAFGVPPRSYSRAARFGRK